MQTGYQKIAPILAFCALFPVAAQASRQTESQDRKAVPRLREEVIVTATRYQEPLASIPAKVTIITEADIARSAARDIPEILRTQVGIHVMDITGNRRSYRVDLRGFGETAQSNTLVLVDGRRVNQADLSGTDWYQIPLDRVSRIEIIRGGRGSVLYGDNAGGGVINIITRQGQQDEAGIELLGGSFGTAKGGAYLRGEGKNRHYIVSGSYFNSEGYRDNSASRGGDLGANITVQLADSFRMSMSGGFHSDRTGLPGTLKESDFEAGISRRGTVHPRDFAEVDDYYFLIRPQLSLAADSLLKTDISVRQRRSLFYSSFFGGTFQGDTDITTVTLSPQLVIKAPLHTLPSSFTVGLDYSNSSEDILNTAFFGGSPSESTFALKKGNHGVFLHEELYLAERLAVSGGYRYDRANFTFSPSTPSAKAFDQHVYTAGIIFNPSRETYLYSSYSRSFRYPLLDEMFNFYTNTIDTGLAPQESRDVEAGLRHYLKDSLYCNLHFFQVATTDELFFNPTGGSFGFGANENIDGTTRRRGMEVSLGGNIGNVTLSGGYSYTDARIRTGRYRDMRIPSVPTHTATVDSVLYLDRGITVWVNGSYVGDRWFEGDFGNVFGTQKKYFVLNARLRRSWSRYSAFLDLNNLLNHEYSEYGAIGSFPVERGYFPSPGFHVRLGLSVGF